MDNVTTHKLIHQAVDKRSNHMLKKVDRISKERLFTGFLFKKLAECNFLLFKLNLYFIY